MAIQTIRSSPNGWGSNNYLPLGLSDNLLGFQDENQVRKQAQTAIAYGAGLVAFGLVVLMFLGS